MFNNPELKSLSRYVRSYLGGLKSLCVDVDGQEWKYLEGGKGETIIFLHGGMGSKTQWRSLMQLYLPDYRVVAIDIPGLCVNQPFRIKKHSFRQLGVWLANVIDQLRVPRVHLVGVSLGAAISAYFAASFPDKVRSLTILGFPSELLSGEHKTEELLKGYLQSLDLKTVDDLEAFYKRAYFSAPAVPKIVLRYNLREFQKYRRVLEIVLQELADSRPVMMAGLRKIKASTLVIYGCSDRVATPAGAGFWQLQIPHVQYHDLPECGHMLHIEKPDEIAFLHKQMLRTLQQKEKPPRDSNEETGRFVRLD